MMPPTILPGVLALAGEVVHAIGECLECTSNSIISRSEHGSRGDHSKWIECTTRHPLYRHLEASVLCEEGCEEQVHDEV